MLLNIKSRLILSNIFSFLEDILKLKITVHNKQLQNKLYLELKDFVFFKIIKDFNKKYNSSIANTNIKKINLDKNEIKNSGLHNEFSSSEF